MDSKVAHKIGNHDAVKYKTNFLNYIFNGLHLEIVYSGNSLLLYLFMCRSLLGRKLSGSAESF